MKEKKDQILFFSILFILFILSNSLLSCLLSFLIRVHPRYAVPVSQIRGPFCSSTAAHCLYARRAACTSLAITLPNWRTPASTFSSSSRM